MSKSFDVNTVSVQMTVEKTKVTTVLDKEAEQQRCENEAARVVAEAERSQAEEQRAASETEREQTEELRLLSETQRSAAEMQRNTNEEARTAAEVQRVQSESERMLAEAERQEAYKQMNNTFANALKGSASGSVVFLDDVSPVEHKAEVKVSGVENLENVTLIQTGKNLSKNVTRNDTGSSSVRVTLDNNLFTFDGVDMSRNTGVYTVNDKNGCFFLQPGQYTFSVQYVGGVCNAIGGEGVVYIGLHKIGTTNKTTYTGIYKDTTLRSRTFTITEANWYYVYFVGCGDFENLQYHIQVETGSVATPYEEYKETTYPVTADGTVDNVALYHPYTSLIPDTAGAVVECLYNKDSNKVIEKIINAIISLGGNV